MHAFFQRYPVSIWPVFIAMSILLLVALGGDVRDALRLDLSIRFPGEAWRLMSAHWVHLGWYHGLLNGAGFLLLAWMQPKGHWLKWLAFYFLSSVLISVYLMNSENIASYVGASGVLHGLLILGAFFSQWLEPWRRNLMILAITAKLIWEQTPLYSDASVSTFIGGHVATEAHLIGGVCGLVVIAFNLAKSGIKSAD